MLTKIIVQQHKWDTTVDFWVVLQVKEPAPKADIQWLDKADATAVPSQHESSCMLRCVMYVLRDLSAGLGSFFLLFSNRVLQLKRTH